MIILFNFLLVNYNSFLFRNQSKFQVFVTFLFNTASIQQGDDNISSTFRLLKKGFNQNKQTLDWLAWHLSKKFLFLALFLINYKTFFKQVAVVSFSLNARRFGGVRFGFCLMGKLGRAWDGAWVVVVTLILDKDIGITNLRSELIVWPDPQHNGERT